MCIPKKTKTGNHIKYLSMGYDMYFCEDYETYVRLIEVNCPLCNEKIKNEKTKLVNKR